MPRVSIIAEDDSIVIDCVAKMVDCTKLREARISAVQWYGHHGQIEYQRHAKPNETFDSLEQFQSLVDGAKSIPSPKPPTPQELDETHNRFMLEYPDARRAWEQRDNEVKRLHEEAMKRDPKWQEMQRLMQSANENEPPK